MQMKFLFTPEEAQSVALAVARHKESEGFHVRVEAPLAADAPLATTLLAQRSEFSMLIETQGSLLKNASVIDLARWIASRRFYCELYIATHMDAETRIGLLKEWQDEGIGLLLVDDDNGVIVQNKARNPALVISPDPTLKLGRYRGEILEAVRKFNNVDRKDGLRDMCELVERLTEQVAMAAARRGRLTYTEQQVLEKDWNTRINLLASTNACGAGQIPPIDDRLKTDLHSFRNARNLIDHPVRGNRQEIARQRQFADRMALGPRLVAELLAAERRL